MSPLAPHQPVAPVPAATASTPPARLTAVAATQTRYGSPDGIRSSVVDLPRPGAGQVVIEVHAAGVDRGAWHLATGRPYVMRLFGFGLRRPKQPVVGTEVAGIVAAIGPDVTSLAVGDVVFGAAHGSFATFAIADAKALARVPAGVSCVEAAASGVSGVAAQDAFERAGVQPGHRVLVLGAAGGVGSFVTQLAAAAGARVTGVASAAKADLVADLGAAEVIDYRSTDVTASGQTYDVIIDSGGLTPLRRLRRILAPTGTLVIVGGEGGGPIAGGAGRQVAAALVSLATRQTLTGILSQATTSALERLGARIARGEARPAVTATYSLEDAATALVDLERGRVTGKAVIAVRQSSQRDVTP